MSLKGKILHRNSIFVLIVLLVSSLLLLMPNLYNSPYAREEQRCLGRVLEADNSSVRQFGLVRSGTQGLLVLILEGPHEGREVHASNVLIGKMESDKMFRVGDRVFLVVTTAGDQITAATAYDHYRLNTELLLLGLFAALLCAMAGWSGMKALLSFFFAILVLLCYLLLHLPCFSCNLLPNLFPGGGDGYFAGRARTVG